jgi:hypothetical protein
MPQQLERELKAKVNRLHPNWSEERKNAYIYSVLRKTGWKPKKETR